MSDRTDGRQAPAINAPTVVVVTIALLVAVHFYRSTLTRGEDIALLLQFAFIPARYLSDAGLIYSDLPADLAVRAWTFVSYAFLHGDWLHLAVNSFWMQAFGSVVARRFGAVRFALFSLICAVAGVALHLALYWGEVVPVVGASAAISGQMAGAVRFIFARPSNIFQASRMRPEHMQRQSLWQVFSNPRALGFLGVWIALNLLFGVSSSLISGVESQIAWEAHLGGFFCGLLFFDLFDRRFEPAQ